MENKVESENFVVIQGWMIRDLQLTGSELIIYAIIYGLSQTEDQAYTGGLQYLADWTNLSKQGVIYNINSLINKKMIIKREKLVNGIKVCEYVYNKLNTIQPTEHRSANLINNIKKENSNTIINNNITLKEKDKKTRHKHGTYGRVLLTETEYDRLLNELGEERLEKQIELLDEYIESNNNKNKYTNFNLVLRKSIKENWFNNNRSVSAQPRTKKNEPDWLENYVNKFEEGVEDL